MPLLSDNTKKIPLENLVSVEDFILYMKHFHYMDMNLTSTPEKYL